MSKITAIGTMFGRSTTFEITVEAGKLVIVCKNRVLTPPMQEIVENRLRSCIKTAGPIAGTYYPPENTLNAAVSGIQNGFFHSGEPEIIVDGMLEEIPYEEGVVF